MKLFWQATRYLLFQRTLPKNEESLLKTSKQSRVHLTHHASPHILAHKEKNA
jgi:hypothetical protein